jgi:hypothetical protein
LSGAAAKLLDIEGRHDKFSLPSTVDSSQGGLGWPGERGDAHARISSFGTHHVVCLLS